VICDGAFPVKELKNPNWIKFKGVLFLVVGILAALLLIYEHQGVKTVLLLSIAVWCFCRFYYFAFYVIEHYVDSSYPLFGAVVVCGLFDNEARWVREVKFKPRRGGLFIGRVQPGAFFLFFSGAALELQVL